MAYTFIGIGDEFVGTGLSVDSRSDGSGWYKARLRVKLNSQSVANNTSNITIYFDLSSIPSDSGYMWSGYPNNTAGSYKLGWKEIDWHYSNTYYMPTSFQSTGGTNNFRNVGSWTVDVPHEVDGTLDLDGVGIIYTQGTNGVNYDPKNFTRDTTNLIFPTILRTPHVKVKTNSGWQEGKVLVKTSDTVWKEAKEVYVKTNNGWQVTTLRGN